MSEAWGFTWRRNSSFLKAVDRDFLLLEVPAVFFIHKDKIQVVFYTEFVVDVAVSRCQFIWA